MWTTIIVEPGVGDGPLDTRPRSLGVCPGAHHRSHAMPCPTSQSDIETRHPNFETQGAGKGGGAQFTMDIEVRVSTKKAPGAEADTGGWRTGIPGCVLAVFPVPLPSSGGLLATHSRLPPSWAAAWWVATDGRQPPRLVCCYVCAMTLSIPIPHGLGRLAVFPVPLPSHGRLPGQGDGNGNTARRLQPATT